MHLAKFAPKLTLFPHQSISRGWKIDTSKNGPWKPKLPPFGKKSQTKSIPEESEPSEPETPETAKKSARLPSPPRQRPSISRIARATEDAAAESNARPDPRRGAQREHEEDYRIVSAPGPRRRRRRKACPLSLLQLQRGEGGLKKKKRERERGWWRKWRGKEEGGTRRDAGERRKTR